MSPTTPADWRDQANCLGMDPDLFFPPHGGMTAEVKLTCDRCPVRRACLIDALETRERHGIRGGVTAEDRAIMLDKGDRRRLREQARHGLRLVTT